MSSRILNPYMLIAAYTQGYFPMPSPSGEIRWYRPDPRAILPFEKFHVSHSLKQRLKKKNFTVTFNENFREVMTKCANRPETWINDEFKDIYGQLHDLKRAHSVEVYYDDKLSGGLYGVSVGGAFFGESMFHEQTDASKIALCFLVDRLIAKGFKLLECQFITSHLKTMGVVEIPDSEYMRLLHDAVVIDTSFT